MSSFAYCLYATFSTCFTMHCHGNKRYLIPTLFCCDSGTKCIIEKISLLKSNGDISVVLSHMLLRTFGACSPEVKRYLFKSYCGSMYTAHLWCKHTQKQIRQLHVAYNNVFRRLLHYDKYCSASNMFVENSCSVSIRRAIYNFRERVYCRK